jgi:O-antigen/teichoic acid export membrane protein
MKPEPVPIASTSSEKSILARFAHLLSAQGVEGVASFLFFNLYLAWLDTSFYGEVMYAMAAGSIVMKVVQFGLYYPLVSDLGSAEPDKAPEVLNRVNVIKLALLAPCMAAVLATIWYRGFPLQMALIIVFISLGFALEGIAETFFADLRVKGRQDKEARIKIIASVLSYGFGFGTAALGLNPIIVSLFRLVSAAVKIGFGISSYVKDYAARVLMMPDWPSVRAVFRAASVFALIEILGIVYNKTNIFFLESAAGVDGVATYSATWSIVDAVSILASEQLLGWVIFPLLAGLWWKNRHSVGRLVRSNAQWLLALAFPIMFVLHAESDLLIGLIYHGKFSDAVWMQKYLVWTILLSFENNLFQYVMMVAGAAKMLLVFTVAATALNLVFNVVLVQPLGLEGGCLVIVLTKLVMTIFTFAYCQVRFRFFGLRDFLFPVSLAGLCLGFFVLMKPLATLQPAVVMTLLIYFAVLFRLGPRFLGRLPGRQKSPEV